MRIIIKILIGIMWINYSQTAEALPVSLFNNVVHNLNSSAMDVKNEIWKDILGYNELYQVSNIGNVRKKKTKKILKKYIGTNGYYQVNLYVNKKTKSVRVHKLVAIAFLNYIPDGSNKVKVIDHKDRNRKNNNVDNLRIVTQRINIHNKKYKHSSRFIGVSWNKNNLKWVAQLCLNGSNKFLGYFYNEKIAKAFYDYVLSEYNDGKNVDYLIIKNKSSKYKGVCFYKKRNLWLSSININSKTKHLGYFESEYEASVYYQNALIAIKNNEEIQTKSNCNKLKQNNYVRSRQIIPN